MAFPNYLGGPYIPDGTLFRRLPHSTHCSVVLTRWSAEVDQALRKCALFVDALVNTESKTRGSTKALCWAKTPDWELYTQRNKYIAHKCFGHEKLCDNNTLLYRDL